MSPARAKRKFPQLAIDEIIYCPVFYEGMHDDARTNLAIAQTAAKEGAAIANYVEAKAFIHEDEKNSLGKVIGAVLVDKMTGKEFKVYAKSVLLCGGPCSTPTRAHECSALLSPCRRACGRWG